MASDQKEQTITNLSTFPNYETVAVTVDRVVLTAAAVGPGLVVFTFVRPAVSTLTSQIGWEVTKAGSRMMTSNCPGI